MGRPPCCDKVGIKKGPWTPEEDIILVSYIQEHGPGNWRSVPTNTGLLRCSKSCRLRWTNYLRPGIKRGNFTPHEEGMIIHLQALLGNKWAAIASYLPQRTDNDIKNYWNTHLKKKLKKFQSSSDPNTIMAQNSATNQFFMSKCVSPTDQRKSLDNNFSNTTDSSALIGPNHQSSCTYASSTENISRLLEGWMRSSPKPPNSATSTANLDVKENLEDQNNKNEHDRDHGIGNNSVVCYSRPKADQQEGGGGGGDDLISHEEIESILSLENLNYNINVAWDKSSSSCDSATATNNITKCFHISSASDILEKDDYVTMVETNKKQKSDHHNTTAPPLSFLEKWLLDESGAAGQVGEIMELSSPIF